MLDTITRTTFRTLLPSVVDQLKAGKMAEFPGWRFQLLQSSNTRLLPTGTQLVGNHDATGIYVSGIPHELRTWTASLARVLHGFNGVQIKNDQEIQAAMDKIHAILDEVSTGPGLVETYRRLDVALNLAHPEPQRLVSALRNARHPWIRKETERYAVGSIRYPGTDVVFHAYWKRPAIRTTPKRKTWKTPDVLRLEIQLKSADKIAEFLHLEEPPITNLPPMRTIYSCFREFMQAFPRCSQNDVPCSMAALLALCESQNLHLPGGENVMDWHRRKVGTSGHAKMRTKVSALSAKFLDIDWSELFPADAIPATTDVLQDGSTVLVPSTPLPPRPLPVRFGCPPPYTPEP